MRKRRGPDVFPRRPIPVAHQDRVHHQARFAFPEQEISDRLGHQVPPREPDKDRDGIDGLADERDRVGDGSRAVDLDNKSLPSLWIVTSRGEANSLRLSSRLTWRNRNGPRTP